MDQFAEARWPEVHYLNHETTLKSWLLTHDHKRIGVIYLFLVLLGFLMGGTFALLIRIEHLTPGPTIMGPMTYNRMFTLHGIIMVWFFMIPGIPNSFGNFFLPIMIGAKDVAFPRLNLGSVYVYTLGLLVTLFAMLWGGTDTGWTFYTPYSTQTPTKVLPVLVGIFIVGFSTIMTGLNFVVTVHTMRKPGMKWMEMPLFVWTLYGTAVIQLLATPVLAMTVALVAVERVFRFGIFDPSRGGDPILFQHFFWFYSHPAVYIMVLPAMGVISELVCAVARKNISSYKLVAVSTFGIAAVGFFSWGHHLFTSGMSTFASGAFGILSMFVAIFTAIKVFTWSATLYKGSIHFDAKLVYILGFLALLVFGGMTGVALATVGLDVYWQDTYFVVAHFHFIMVGSVLMAFLGGLHYWWPKMFGRMYDEKAALVASIPIALGFFFTFVPQFYLGNMGMPRRYFYYPAEMQWLQVASTAGATILALALFLQGAIFALSLRYGAVAGDDPWGSRGFEWYTTSPPAPHNFAAGPHFQFGLHDYTVLVHPTRPRPSRARQVEPPAGLAPEKESLIASQGEPHG